jgi:hypothetical protein
MAIPLTGSVVSTQSGRIVVACDALSQHRRRGDRPLRANALWGGRLCPGACDASTISASPGLTSRCPIFGGRKEKRHAVVGLGQTSCAALGSHRCDPA